MKNSAKETNWSRFAAEIEEKQPYVTGAEVIAVAKDEILNEQKLGSVLELGCGTGLYTEALQKVATVLATDFSDEMIKAENQKKGNSGM